MKPVEMNCSRKTCTRISINTITVIHSKIYMFSVKGVLELNVKSKWGDDINLYCPEKNLKKNFYDVWKL